MASRDLEAQARMWQTPKGVGGGNVSRGRDRMGELLLAGQARAWPTPAARDVKGANTNDTHSTDQLANVTARWSGPPGPRMSSDGGPPLLSTPRLNPRFVEWLMGFPIGWTAFDALGTEWSRWRQLMRSELSRLERGWPTC